MSGEAFKVNAAATAKDVKEARDRAKVAEIELRLTELMIHLNKQEAWHECAPVTLDIYYSESSLLTRKRTPRVVRMYKLPTPASSMSPTQLGLGEDGQLYDLRPFAVAETWNGTIEAPYPMSKFHDLDDLLEIISYNAPALR